MKTIDNYLPTEDFDELCKLIMWNHSFPFFLGEGVAEGENIGADFNNWYASHVLGADNKIFSLLNFKVKVLLRLKVNFYPHTDQIYEHKPHVDYDFNNKAALLSLNTCDGFTRLHDGTKVDSIANRLLLFDGHESHNSSTTTNASGRWNININYWDNGGSYVDTVEATGNRVRSA